MSNIIDIPCRNYVFRCSACDKKLVLNTFITDQRYEPREDKPMAETGNHHKELSTAQYIPKDDGATTLKRKHK